MLLLTGLKSSWGCPQPSLLQAGVPKCFLLLSLPLEARQQKMAKPSQALGMDPMGKHTQGHDSLLSSTTSTGGLQGHACLGKLLAGKIFLPISQNSACAQAASTV